LSLAFAVSEALRQAIRIAGVPVAYLSSATGPTGTEEPEIDLSAWSRPAESAPYEWGSDGAGTDLAPTGAPIIV